MPCRLVTGKSRKRLAASGLALALALGACGNVAERSHPQRVPSTDNSPASSPFQVPTAQPPIEVEWQTIISWSSHLGITVTNLDSGNVFTRRVRRSSPHTVDETGALLYMLSPEGYPPEAKTRLRRWKGSPPLETLFARAMDDGGPIAQADGKIVYTMEAYPRGAETTLSSYFLLGKSGSLPLGTTDIFRRSGDNDYLDSYDVIFPGQLLNA